MVLKESLLKLMADRPIGKITIKEICELADVNRGTFYAYYNDQYDLLKQIQDEFATEVKELLDKRQSKAMDSLQMITELINYFMDQRSLCKILFNIKGDLEFINKLMYNAYGISVDGWEAKSEKLTEKQRGMLYAFVSNGAAAIIQYWTMDDMQEPPQEVAKFILQATNYGTSSFLEQSLKILHEDLQEISASR